MYLWLLCSLAVCRFGPPEGCGKTLCSCTRLSLHASSGVYRAYLSTNGALAPWQILGVYFCSLIW